MRLLLVARNFWPELTGIGRYTGDFVDWMHARGHRVSVVTTHKHYPDWHVPHSERTRAWSRDDRKPYRVIRCPSYLPQRLTAKTRLANIMSFAASSLPPLFAEAVRLRPDIIATVMPTLAAAPAVIAAAKLCGAGTWLHVQDLEIDTAFHLGLINSRLFNGARSAERRILGSFDCVSTISLSMRAQLLAKGLSERDVSVFPNWVDQAKLYPLPHSSAMRAAAGIADNATVALYSGSLVAKQGIEIIIEFARVLERRKDISFIICGDGPLKHELAARARDIRQVHFLPLQPAERLNALLNMADIHLLPQLPGVSDLVMPSKLGPMLATGRPVVAAVPMSGCIAQLIGQAGIIVPPGQVHDFANAITTLAEAPHRRREMGAVARRTAVRELDSETVLANIEAMLLSLANRSPQPLKAT